MKIEEQFIIYNKTCLYDSIKNQTIVYCQYTPEEPVTVFQADEDVSVIHCTNDVAWTDKFGWDVTRPEFVVVIPGKPQYIHNVVIQTSTELTRIPQLRLDIINSDQHKLSLSGESAIITTICKDYGHRLDEWIKYHLNMGFDGIVIFDNDSNTSNQINEGSPKPGNIASVQNICNKYRNHVYRVEFPYTPLLGPNWDYWNSMQRISLSLGVNAFKNQCKNIALIDADEFIHIPSGENVKQLLQRHKTIQMSSNIITNKGDHDIVNNNILDMELYVGEPKFNKVILDTTTLQPGDMFIRTPHDHPTQTTLDCDTIVHYHAWMNERYKYSCDMKSVNLFNFKTR